MSREPSPAPAAPVPLPTITVGLCASAKKHQQSFDALREAAAHHNERLRAECELQLASTARTVRSDPNAGVSLSPRRSGASPPLPAGTAAPVGRPRSRRTSRSQLGEGDRAATPRSGGGRSPRARPVVDNYLFRLVNLNYDVARHSMVVCADDAVKGEQPPRRAADGDDDGTDTATSASDSAAAEAARLAEEVDVVLHKVATFGSASAIRALERWCRQSQKQRSRLRRPPLVVVDPLEKVHLLMTRSMLYKLLDNTDVDGRPVALIPRTFMWNRPAAQGRRASSTAAAGAVATPLGIHSFSAGEEDAGTTPRANGSAQGRWWIAKPDEGTGPAFTHHLVMWRTRSSDVRMPPAVQAALPKESQRFILQELYVYALPVVIKVYCIAPHIYIKVNPTVNLLSHLWESTRGSTAVDVPVLMDSQDKAFFSAVASMSTATSRPTLSPATSGADYVANSNDRSATPPQQQLEERPLPPPQDAVPWESMVAAGDLWDAFLAPGTPAHVAIGRLAQQMSGFGGIGLTMYGFDVVLVPQHLAHAHQRKTSRGIGHTEGATVRYEAAPASTPPKVVVTAPAAGVALPYTAKDMFDPATGAPTPLLLDSIPVVIDVNYFPGYKGVAVAPQHMLELIAGKYARAKEGNGSSTRRSDEAAGTRDKKHQCVSM